MTTYAVSLTFEELTNLLIASIGADVDSFTPAARGALKRAQHKVQSAVPLDSPLRRDLAEAIGRARAMAHDGPALRRL
jgi:hypothetical protein